MAEANIKAQAIEFAAAFYEMPDRDLTDHMPVPGKVQAFRKTYPTLQDYLKGREHQPDGRILQGQPCWKHFVKMARASMYARLTPYSLATAEEKERVYKAILEDREEDQAAVQHQPIHQRDTLDSKDDMEVMKNIQRRLN